MGERPKVVVDVQFQGSVTEYGIIQEQFEFELVGGRIYVRPCAADHPQGSAYSDYPRKRPASPRNEPYEISRVVKPRKSQERQSRPAKQRSSSPSPSRNNSGERQTNRYVNRSTSPYVPRKMFYQDSDERFPPSRRRPQRGNVNRDDSNTSFSSYRAVRSQPRQIKKESSRWNISKRGPDNYSIGSSASLGDVNCGSMQYCAQQDNGGNYSFTERSKNIDRMKRGRKNLAVQAGYDEDLCFKRLKQFSDGRNKNELIQRNNLAGREMTGPTYDRYNSDFDDEEPRTNMRQYRNRDKKECLFSCHPCCYNEMPPAIVFEEYEMFASTETITCEPDKYKEEDVKKSERNKKPEKAKVKVNKKEPENLNEPEEDGELEVKRSKYKVQESKKPKKKEQNSKKEDKNKQVEKQKSKNDRTSNTIARKEEGTDDDIEENRISLKNTKTQSKNRLSPESTKKKEEKKGKRETSAQSKNRLSPESAKKKEEQKEKRETSAQSKDKFPPESEKKKEVKKEEREINLSMIRNCCRKAHIYKKAHFDE